MAKYLIFHPYLPEYGIQGSPVMIPYSLIRLWKLEGKNWVREAKKRVQDQFLRWNMRPVGRIHPHHRELADDIEFKVQIKELSADQVKHYQFLSRGKLHVRKYVNRPAPRERSRHKISKFRRMHKTA